MFSPASVRLSVSVATCLGVAYLSSPASAQVFLTEIVTNGTTSNGTYIDRYDWHTSTLPSGAFNNWVINGTNLDGAFINGPTSANSAVNLPLSIGTYSFTLYNNVNLPDVDYYGINLGFGTQNPNMSLPNISAFGPAWTGGLRTFSANTASTRFYDSIVPAAGTLSFVTGDYRVTLTDFFFTKRDLYNRDRVNAYNNSPGAPSPTSSAADNVSGFSLRVEAAVAPEPSTLTLLFPVLLPAYIVLRRRRR